MNGKDGRKRPPYSPDETLDKMTTEADNRQRESQAVQKEARAIRASELEKQRRQDEERGDEDSSSYHHNGRYSRAGSTSSAISSSNGVTPMARLINGSKIGDSTEHLNNEDNPRELRKKLNEMEERYKKHAMYQTQLENDNQKLIYEVDSLKDIIEDYEELIVELKRQFKEKNREVENQKRQNKDLTVDFERLKEILKLRDELIENSGLVLYTDDENGQAVQQQVKSILPAALLSPETAKLLDSLGDGTIDDKLSKLLEEKGKYREQINKLNSDLEDEKFKCGELERKLQQTKSKLSDTKDNSLELQEMQRNYNREINELRLKVQRLEHENFLLKEEKARVETQIKNLQRNIDEMNGKESDLEKEKRDLRRELNEANSKINDLQTKVDVMRRTQRTRHTNLLSNRINLASTPTSSTTNLQQAAAASSASSSSCATTTSSTTPLAMASGGSTASSSTHTSPLLAPFNYEQMSAANSSMEKHDDSGSSHRHDDSITLNSNNTNHVNNIINTSGNTNENQNTSDTNDDEKNNSNTSDSTNSSSTN